MAETTEVYEAKSSLDDRDTSYRTWSPDNVHKDLVCQGGLHPSYIGTRRDGFYGYLEIQKGSHRGNKFSMRWEHKSFLLVMLENEDPDLIEAFAKVVGSKPLARYVFEGEKALTFEWDFQDPDERYKQLSDDIKRLKLERIN